MNAVPAIAAIGDASGAPVAMRLGALPAAAAPQAGATGFGDVLMAGLRSVDAKVESADKLVQQFAVDDSVPVHQVTMALEQAKLSVELAMQVRAKLLDGFQQLMNMPL